MSRSLLKVYRFCKMDLSKPFKGIYYDTEAPVVCQSFQTDPERGLNSSQIGTRLEQYVVVFFSMLSLYLLSPQDTDLTSFLLLRSHLFLR